MTSIRAGRWWIVAAFVVAALIPAGGCSCDASCGEPRAAAEVPVLTAEVLEVDTSNGLLRMRSDDGAEREVRVRGRVEVLDEGTTYRFPVDGGWTAVPAPCDCGGPYVTDLDGEVVDTAYLGSWRDVDGGVVRVGAVVIVVSVAAIASWALARRRRGLPL